MPELFWVYTAGWAGTVGFLACYAYVGLVTDYHRGLYFGGNLLAAGLQTWSSAVLGTWQSVGINLFFVVVSLAALAGRPVAFAGLRNRYLRTLLLVTFVPGVALLVPAFAAGVAVLGWSGAFALCGAYLLFASGRLGAEEFHVLNAYASATLMPRLWLDANWPVLGLEVCWFVVSVIAWLRHAPARTAAPV